ncbi:MAG TPA: phosphatase PAP2 family protein [Baekduia sp.]|nr:phosphatase PAP2 family protein [Baekduia sp.]
MLLLVLICASLLVGCAVAAAARRYPQASPTGRPTIDLAREAGATAARHHWRRVIEARRHPGTATGLALTLAGMMIIAGTAVVGVLAYLVRSDSRLVELDNSLSHWADRNQSTFSADILDAVTRLGATSTVVVLAVVLLVVETRRTRSPWIAPFLVLVIAGNAILYTTIKDLVDRLRPALNPIAETLGPSYPSGHSATAAAFFAAAALLLGRGRGQQARAILAGVAAGVAVAVAATRVLLDVHWLSDVIGGLALGWAWFAVCAIAFGGRLLRFGAAAESVGQASSRS